MVRVLVTGAAGQIGYSLIPLICGGYVFNEEKVELVLLDLEFMADALRGVGMEVQDCAYPKLATLTLTSSPEEAFKDIDCAFLVGSMPRKEGMDRSELLKINGKIFEEQGKLLDKYAKKTVKVLVVGNPANTNCYVAMKNAPSIPSENFTAMVRLDHNRMQAQISHKLSVPTSHVKQCAIWGNHSDTQYPDVSNLQVENGHEVDLEWARSELINVVSKRGGAIIKARKLSSAMSAARAAADHMKDWVHGSDGRWVSMAIHSKDNEYGVDKDLIFGFPVTVDSTGKYTIVKGLSLDEFSRNKIKATEAELITERKAAFQQ